jgi:hypothetical protein
LALTVVPPGKVSCPCPPAALATKFAPHVIELLGNPLITVVRIRLGRRMPPPADAAVSTSPGDGNSQHAFELMFVNATLVMRVCGLVVVRIT